MLIVAMLIAAPCSSSAPIDEGKPAPCSGLLISVERAKAAIVCKRSLAVLSEHRYEACLPCPKTDDAEMIKIASASFFTGFILGLLLLVVR